MFELLMHNKVAVVIVAFLIAGGAWYALGGNGSNGDAMLVTEDFSTPTADVDKDLVATLLQLRSVKLDGTIFTDPAFQSLKDFGSQIIPEPVGRPNPFAPIEGQLQAASAAGAGTEKGAPKTAPKTAPKIVPAPKQ